MASLLTPPSELETPPTIAGMFYGQPGVGKTTLALSAPNPVLIDLDQGMYRVKPQHRVPSLQVDGYEQVLALLDGDELKPFDTLVFDTAGKLIDRIGEYVIKNNPKARTGAGQLSQQGWGEVKTIFTALRKRLKMMGKSVMFVAHESEEKNGEDTIKRPDIAGSARKDIVKDLDFMGYMEMSGKKAVINFSPTDKFYAKNSLHLDAAIEIPQISDDQPNNWVAKYIFKASEAKLNEQTTLRKQYEVVIAAIDAQIKALQTPEQVNAYYATIANAPVLWDSPYYTRAELKKRVDALGITFDRDSKLFVAKPAPAESKADAIAAATPAAGAAKADDKPAISAEEQARIDDEAMARADAEAAAGKKPVAKKGKGAKADQSDEAFQA